MDNDRDLLAGERGSAMVELAICAPVLVLLFVGSMEFHKLTSYKRKVIGATRYACWEVVARKGEADLDKNVATEMSNLWFPEIDFSADEAVVNNFTADNAQGSRVQLKVERMSSLEDLENSGLGIGSIRYGNMVAEAAVRGFDLGPFSYGFHLLGDETDDRIQTTVRMTYRPTFFPIVMNFFALDESRVQDEADRPRSWNVDENLMSVGGDVPFARMVLCNGTWDEYRREQLTEKIEGGWFPKPVGEATELLGDITFGVVDVIKCHVEPDLVCPYSLNPGDDYWDARDWWENPSCQCTHDEEDDTQDGGEAEDPRDTAAAEQEEYENEKARLEQRIADDNARIDEINQEIEENRNDGNPDNDDEIADLERERDDVTRDRDEAQSQLDQMNENSGNLGDN